MSSYFDDAFARVKELAAEFKANANFYLSPQYQEAEARRDFIDKFFIAFGWDVNHDRQKNPYEQEVKVERKEHGVSQRRADYAFYLAPNFRDVKFYIEAKKPHGDIATMDNYFQIVRYGWNSQTPIAALFDFEQFEIVDCRFKPDVETALQRNLKKFHYSQYSNKETFAEIYWLFSREAVAGGSLEKYAETLPKKRGAVQRGLFKGGYQSIDDAFLEELDAHRDTLAHIFKNSNPNLDGETLTEITQRTLDRLVFIRFLEDKLIEPQYLVAKFGERGSAWGDFIATSRRLDGIYNGIVFKENAVLDKPTFKVDDDQFAGICEALCHINSAYDFNAIPIHILGSIYERFLGKVIVATDKRARVEEKPEGRKAGGVYYTPEYVVRYIVENTVGNLIEGKTPAQIAEMKFADIACGSGSFLLGVYDLLIRYHMKFYNDNPRKAKNSDVIQRDDGLHLSLRKKREILVSNIYGVDIDRQAVEVAQLSLYLKLLQDETPGSTRQYFLDFEQQSLLPSLHKNIVSGNSLIGTDIFAGKLFATEEERRLNPMDFEQRFPEIMKQGGFDAIIGNPPYLNVDDTWGKNDLRLVYLKDNYPEVYNDKTDILFYFLAKALKVCRGSIGFIVSRAFLQAYKADKLRSLLLCKSGQLKIIDFQNAEIFKGVGITTCICLLSRSKTAKDIELFRLDDESKPYPLEVSEHDLTKRYTKISVPRSALGGQPWEFTPVGIRGLNSKIDRAGESLGKVLILGQGMQTGRNDVFGIKGENEIKFLELDASCRYQRARNSDIEQFHITPSGEWLLYLENFKTFSSLPKPTQNFLNSQKAVLIERAAYQRGNCEWWKYTWPLHKEYYNRPRIICPYLSRHNQFACVSKERILGLTDTTVAFDNNQPEDLRYILALLNSRLLSFRFRSIGKMKGGGVLEYFWNSISKLPIRRIDFSKPGDKERHDKTVLLVEQIMTVKQQFTGAQSDTDKDFYENKCASLGRQIDALVYELYGLTDAEIKIVEGAAV